MKRFLFCIVMLFCMGMTMSAQGLKTYSGPYRANAHFLLGTQKATYTYKNAEDGTRIYEGNFTYSCITNPKLYLKVTGRFHDDCKEGLWTYIDKSTSETKTLKINFKEGYRNGIYEYTYTTRGTVKESLKATMKDGVMIGPVSGHVVQYDYQFGGGCFVWGKGIFCGQTDEEGLADGSWKLTMKLGDGSTRVFYDKWEHGVKKESYYIDDTTGDKEDIGGGGIPSVIFDIVRDPCKMEWWIDRGSDKPWQGTLLGPEDVRKEYTETELNAVNSGVPTEYYEKCDVIIRNCDVDPKYEENVEAYVQQRIVIPESMSKAIGNISLKCVVERDGTLSDIEIMDSDEPVLDEEVIRVLKEMKGWCPGMKNNAKVRSYVTISMSIMNKKETPTTNQRKKPKVNLLKVLGKSILNYRR
ncbi:energy transducer TonB [Prevotella copri]|uniref:energy transducer TonB n=1 Tax=Segatella copri TaxID=165179 RepID=UPI001C3834E6|nr:energy transducer TonB [Segatella copri]MBV3415325.1 energy transducer TonB [Segatella copri]